MYSGSEYNRNINNISYEKYQQQQQKKTYLRHGFYDNKKKNVIKLMAII